MTWLIEFLVSLDDKRPRESSFLFQRISVAIQRFNFVVFGNSLYHINDNTRNLLKQTYRPMKKFFLTSSPLELSNEIN